MLFEAQFWYLIICALDKSYPFIVVLLLINFFFILCIGAISRYYLQNKETAARSASLKEATNNIELLNTDKKTVEVYGL